MLHEFTENNLRDLPVLISAKSGLAKFVNYYSKEHREMCAKPVNSRKQTDKHFEKDAEEWGKAIFTILTEQKVAYDRAWDLREKFKVHMNWDTSVENLCKLLNYG